MEQQKPYYYSEFNTQPQYHFDPTNAIVPYTEQSQVYGHINVNQNGNHHENNHSNENGNEGMEMEQTATNHVQVENGTETKENN
jgi:hypothetical protein